MAEVKGFFDASLRVSSQTEGLTVRCAAAAFSPSSGVPLMASITETPKGKQSAIHQQGTPLRQGSNCCVGLGPPRVGTDSPPSQETAQTAVQRGARAPWV